MSETATVRTLTKFDRKRLGRGEMAPMKSGTKTLSLQPPDQRFATEGLAPMARPSIMNQIFMRIVAWAERLNLRYAVHGNPPVYRDGIFPWVAGIEREWSAIRADLDHVLKRREELPAFSDIAADVRTISKDADWKSFMIAGYGLKSDTAVRECPETWRIVQRIPGLKTAMFSIFEPGNHLPAHRGPYNGVLRFHLGLIVPDEPQKVAIRVENQICHWTEGKGLVFDDAYEHEAWNHSNQLRVVLFVDFVKPLRFPANFINWLILNLAVFTPFIKEGVENYRAWEAKFYR